MKKVLLPFLVLFSWMILIGFWSSGFSSFTIFSHTLSKAGDLPRVFPDLELVNHDGEIIRLQENKKFKLVNFVYLSCPLVCHKINNRLETIYHQIDTDVLASHLHFYTLSFDLERDNVERIRSYRAHFTDNGTISNWDFAVPYNLSQEEFDMFLKNLGVWKYTHSETRITNHSIHLFLLDPHNKIIRIFDPARESDEKILKEIDQCLKEHIQ